jgi:hypothetical protein
MKKDWTLREELYKAFHQWPSLLVLFALGCLLGWVSSFILPSYYRATTQIYVGLNPYRSYSDSIYIALAHPKYGNLDDYKNWQMSQLESVIYLDHFLGTTLDKLRKEDPFWNEFSLDELRQILIAEWRTAGTWDLIAEHPDEQRAAQASAAWSRVATENVKFAVDAARETFLIDQELNETISERVHSERRVEILKAARTRLIQWHTSVGDADPDARISNYERGQVYSMVGNVAGLTPAWTDLLNTFPPEDAPLNAYIDWIERAIATIDAELPLLEEQIELLKETQARKQAEYGEAANASLGISPNISIEGLDELPTQKMRSSSRAMLIGGIIGFLAWIFVQIVWSARKEYDQ